jgi:hypothetical protein
MKRRNSITLATLLVAGIALLLLFISFAYAYLLYAAPFRFAVGARLLLVEIPELAFQAFRWQFLLSLLFVAVFAIALAALFPVATRRHFGRLSALVTFAASMVWVQPLVDMSSMLSLQFTTGQGAPSAGLARLFAIITHPWIAWTPIPALLALCGMIAAKAVRCFVKM